MPDLPPEEIERLLKLEAKASPNWQMGTVTDGAGNILRDRCWITLGTQPDGEYGCEAEFAGNDAVANAEFSLAARNLVRPLAERVRELEDLDVVALKASMYSPEWMKLFRAANTIIAALSVLARQL